LKPRREDGGPAYARDADAVVLERPPERPQDGRRELRQLIEKEHAVMRECAGMYLDALGRPKGRPYPLAGGRVIGVA
jgi:hypothetical protein